MSLADAPPCGRSVGCYAAKFRVLVLIGQLEALYDKANCDAYTRLGPLDSDWMSTIEDIDVSPQVYEGNEYGFDVLDPVVQQELPPLRHLLPESFEGWLQP